MNFDNPFAASTYCLLRQLDYAKLYADFSEALRIRNAKPDRHSEPIVLPYCSIHFEQKGSKCTVTNDRGMTIASGNNVTTAQLLSFILKRYW